MKIDDPCARVADPATAARKSSMLVAGVADAATMEHGCVVANSSRHHDVHLTFTFDIHI